MQIAALKEQLDQLRKEVAAARHLDDETREQLAGVAADIEHILEQADADHGSTRARLETTALRFEAEHPKFAQILSDITDTLAKLGI